MKLRLNNYILLLLFPISIYSQSLDQIKSAAEIDSLLLYTEELASLEPLEAIQRAEDMQQWALAKNDSLLYADALRLEAVAHLKQYNFKESISKLNQALSIYQLYDDKEGAATSLNLLAEVETFIGSYYQALQKLEKSLGISRLIDSKVPQVKSHYLLSQIRLKQGKIDEALINAHQAMSLAKEVNSRSQRGAIYNLLANINVQRNEFQQAQRYLKQAFLFNRSMGNNSALAESHAIAAQVAYKQGNLKSAVDEINQALALSREYAFPYQYAEHLLIQSMVLLEAGQDSLALQSAKLADSVAGLHRSIHHLNRDISQQLARSLMATRDSAQALEALLRFNQIDDSIRDFDFQKMLLMREVEGKEAQYQELVLDNELKEELIDRSKMLLLLAGGLIVVFILLIFALMQNVRRKKKYTRHLLAKNETIRLKQKEIKDQQEHLQEKNEELKALDQTKNKIFSVLTHDLRQPLTQIKSVLTLFETDDISDEERISMVGKLKESVDNSSNALENLLLWSKKQLTGITTKIVDIHLLPQVWQLESQVKPNLEAKNLSLEIDIPDFFKIKADMNQLDICMRNLMNNAIKFSTPGGRIVIATQETDKTKVIHFKDEGVGMDENQLQQLQQLSGNVSTLGTMNEKGTGLGILIVHEFMENQNGYLKIMSTKGRGSVFSLHFPKVNKDDSRNGLV